MIKIGQWFYPDGDAHRFLPDGGMKIEDFKDSSLHRAFSYVKKFDNAIDVGTWIGDTTYVMAEKFKNVIGFEANPEVAECCKLNMLEHNIKNTQILDVGLSNKEEKQYFLNKGKKTNSGWISTLNLSEEEKVSAKLVNTFTLDSFNYLDIDFIKIDVDSHEGFLLDGARHFLQKNSPVIQIEIKVRSHYRQNSQMPDAFQLLDSLNYKVKESIGKADYIFLKTA